MLWTLLFIALVAVTVLACGNSPRSKTSTLGDGKVTTVPVDVFAQLVQQKDVWLLDVRTGKEYAEGHIAGSENIDVNQPDFLESVMKSPRYNPAKTKVAVYCRGGKRSMKAANILAQQGCTVYNLDGGFMAWQKSQKVEK
ncbi:MAG: rhodanese-like domain-containing protein [Bacteroidales bacterium]|nr:rhodanese-like domain-containing protein [Bacteroidales bacterium]